MVNKKRKIIIIIAAIVLVAGITTGTTIILINLKKPQETIISPEEKADTTKTQAIDALKNGDTAQAKTLFSEANQEYKDLGDTDNVVDTEAQLYLLEHSSTQSTTVSTDPMAASN